MENNINTAIAAIIGAVSGAIFMFVLQNIIRMKNEDIATLNDHIDEINCHRICWLEIWKDLLNDLEHIIIQLRID